MKVLGINPTKKDSDLGLWSTHDGSACLIEDGEVKYALEEERLTRQKRAYYSFPLKSVEAVLKEADITLTEVDKVAIGREPRLLYRDAYHDPKRYLPSSPKDYGFLKNLATVAASFTEVPEDRIKWELRKAPGDEQSCEYARVSHHRAHMASAKYMSGFEEQLIFTIDGRGEYDSTVVWEEGERLETYSKKQSLGLMYSLGAKHLGFRGGRDAGKVMGLAAYGDERKDFKENMEKIISLNEEGYKINGRFSKINELFSDLFFPERSYDNEIEQKHKDFAFHLQKRLEEAVKSLVSYYVNKKNVNNIALAGGVAMNCKMNKEIKDMVEVDNIFIQPAADDRGISLGAALEVYNREKEIFNCMEHVYYGRSYSNDHIRSLLERAGLEYEWEEEVSQKVAELLAKGKTVGWFQGRMEFGARALGKRSILANPTDEKYRDLVNQKVKSREQWRPFAPSILHEKRNNYLEEGIESPFMILSDKVEEKAREMIPAVVHTDGSCRPQTVRSDVNPGFYNLIKNFEDITGVPVVLNTSFNKSGDPIVESPTQALETFYSTGLDALAIGSFILTKD